MTTRTIVFALAFGVTSAAATDHAAAGARRDPDQRVALDPVLAAYVGGDAEIVARTFAEPREFQDRLRLTEPREFDRWLGSFDRGKAMLVLEIARAATRVA